MAWSLLFRSEHTFANYLGYARVGCALVNKPCHVFDDPVLRRAKVAVAKRGGFKKRVPMFIRLDVIRAMLALVLVEPVWVLTAMWCLTAYTFLLRVPSECLTITIGGGSEDDCQHSSLLGHDDCIVLVLKSRKNKPQGSRLTRCMLFQFCCVVFTFVRAGTGLVGVQLALKFVQYTGLGTTSVHCLWVASLSLAFRLARLLPTFERCSPGCQ